MKDMSFGKNLKTAYKNAGYTQQEFAEELNISKRTLQKYVSGESYPNLDTALKINAILGVSLDYLFSENIVRKEEMNSNVYVKLRELYSQAEPERLACAEIFLDFLLSLNKAKE